MPPDYGAAVATAVLFFLACVASVISKKMSGFKLYLLLWLSTLLRGIGFACRAAQYKHPENDNLAAASLVFRQAGFGISIAVLCILAGCWFKNADDRAKPPRSWPVWSVGVRLLIAPVIIFGPVMGVVAAALIFGVASPSSVATGDQIRQGSTWSFLGVVSILHAVASIAAVYVLRWQHATANAHDAAHSGAGMSSPGDKPKPVKRASSMQRLQSTLRLAAKHAHSWVHMLQAQCLLLQLSTVFRVVSLYHPEYATNPSLFYPLQVLPELLYVLLLLLPTVMVRVGMVGQYAQFAAAVREGRPFQPPSGTAAANGSVPSSGSGKGSRPDLEAPQQ